MRILHLTLHRKWFDAIASGSKREEFREMKPYWIKRLEGKTFDRVHFRNGYRPDSPTMTFECNGIYRDEWANEYAIHLGNRVQED